MYVVCLLFYAIGIFLFDSIFVFNRPNVVDTFSCLTSREGRYVILVFYLLFSNLIFEVICSITDLTASFLLPSAGISGEGDEDYRDKADAQSRFLWRD